VQHLPTRGEIVLFDRSWYNRAGRRTGDGVLHRRRVRRVHAPGTRVRAQPGAQRRAPHQVLVLGEPGRAATPVRERERHPLKQWKLSPIDLASLDKWDDYTAAKEAMFLHTDTPTHRGP
jgi:polyphosphate kinase